MPNSERPRPEDRPRPADDKQSVQGSGWEKKGGYLGTDDYVETPPPPPSSAAPGAQQAPSSDGGGSASESAD